METSNMKVNRKVSLKGIIFGVSNEIEVGPNKTKKVLIVLRVAATTDEFGDPKGREQHWAISALGDKIKTLNVTPDLEGEKVFVEFYVDSAYVESKKEETLGEPQYFINATLQNLTVLK